MLGDSRHKRTASFHRASFGKITEVVVWRGICFSSGGNGYAQKRLADCLGVDEQKISLWERSKRRPTVAAERMLRLLYLEHADGKTTAGENDCPMERTQTDKELEEEAKQVFQETAEGWRMAA